MEPPALVIPRLQQLSEPLLRENNNSRDSPGVPGLQDADEEATFLRRAASYIQRTFRSWIDYWEDVNLRLVARCYDTLDSVPTFSRTVAVVVTVMMIGAFLAEAFVDDSAQVRWLCLQWLRQFILIHLMNSADRIIRHGAVWPVVLTAWTFWSLQMCGYIMYCAGWILLFIERYNVVTSSLIFVFLLLYSVLVGMKLTFYFWPSSRLASIYLEEVYGSAMDEGSDIDGGPFQGMSAARGPPSDRQRVRPICHLLLARLVRGTMSELWTPRTAEKYSGGPPLTCPVCCDEFLPRPASARALSKQTTGETTASVTGAAPEEQDQTGNERGERGAPGPEQTSTSNSTSPEESRLVKLPCRGKHVFHELCVMAWFARGRRDCPLCRQDVEAALLAEINGKIDNDFKTAE